MPYRLCLSTDRRDRVNADHKWRADFARHLGEHGIVAIAMPRALRGKFKGQEVDGLHRAAMRGESTHLRRQVREILKDLRDGKTVKEPGKAKLEQTRREVVADWKQSLGTLIAQGQHELAAKIARFVKSMPPLQTEREALAEQLIARRRLGGRPSPTA